MIEQSIAPAAGTGRVDQRRFRDALGRFPTGVTIVTTRDRDGRDHGFTASSLCSVSLDPALISVCVSCTANCYRAFMACEQFAVSVLRPEHDSLARRFATKGVDKFGAGGFHRTARGLLAVTGALVVIENRGYARYRAGDHIILLGEVGSLQSGSGGPLVFFEGRFSEVAR